MASKGLVFAIAAALAISSCIHETSQESTAKGTSTAESDAAATSDGTGTASASSCASSTATSSTDSCKCKPKCGENEVKSECRPCDQICGEEPRSCALVCIPGEEFCGCKPGYCRDKHTGKCRINCPENEMEVECEPTCELKCGEPAKFCPAICKPGRFCTCIPDTCRDRWGKCVVTDCSAHACPKNEKYTECEPCDQTCGADPKPCAKICKRGHFCQCKEKHCRNERGQCVKI